MKTSRDLSFYGVLPTCMITFFVVSYGEMLNTALVPLIFIRNKTSFCLLAWTKYLYYINILYSSNTYKVLTIHATITLQKNFQ